MSWIGVDLDGTLAHYDGWKGPTHIGAPVNFMLMRVKSWLAKNQEVRIFTARCYPLMFIPLSYSPDWTPQTYEEIVAKEAIEAIRPWCKEHVGRYLAITCIKDYQMWQLWDDRAIQVVQNTGLRHDGIE